MACCNKKLINNKHKLVRGSTPTHIFTVVNDGVDLTKATEIKIRYKQDMDLIVEKIEGDVTVVNKRQCKTTLTEEQTMAFRPTISAYARVVAIYDNGVIIPSKNTIELKVEDM